MGTIRVLSAAALVAGLLLIMACGDHETRVKVHSTDASVSFARRDSTKPLGPGDLRIATTDSAIEVALIGDSLVGGLGAKVRAKVSEALDTTRTKSSGFGASIEKMVKSQVASALDHEMHMPLSDVSDVKYEDGMLVFYGKDGSRMHFFDRDHDKPDSRQTRFSPDDARDFIAVFKAKTGRS